MHKIFSIAELKANKSTIINPIVIPEYIFNKIRGLCDLDVEFTGQLVCRKKIVEYPFLPTVKSSSGGSVYPNQKMVFNNSPDYSTIEFHTHPSLLGDYWANKFSIGDLVTFDKRVTQQGRLYKHILFTPSYIITWGKLFAPDVRIGFGSTEEVKKVFDEWNKKYKCWNI